MTGRLTERQLECLRLSATMTDKDIGRHLCISHHTVSLHVREAMRRLQVSSRKAALRRAIRSTTRPARSGNYQVGFCRRLRGQVPAWP